MECPLVSVWMITYNHEKYIAQAIESVLNQKTDFNIELVIGEDCSTDKTREICLDYAKKYPNLIKVLPTPSNLGVARNIVRTINACTGKYIALLEGDDFWIDSNKIQKQVVFLESNPKCPMVYTEARNVDERTQSIIPTTAGHPSRVSIEYLLENGWFIRTATIMFRNGLIKFPSFYFDAYSTDYLIHVFLAEKGAVFGMEDVTAVYRLHEGGVSRVPIEKQIKRWFDKIELLQILDEHYEKKYTKNIERHKQKLYLLIIETLLRRKKILSLNTFFWKAICKIKPITLTNRLRSVLKKRVLKLNH